MICARFVIQNFIVYIYVAYNDNGGTEWFLLQPVLPEQHGTVGVQLRSWSGQDPSNVARQFAANVGQSGDTTE